MCSSINALYSFPLLYYYYCCCFCYHHQHRHHCFKSVVVVKRPVLGRDLLRRTDSELTHSSAAAPAVASVRQTFRRSKNCLKHPTSNSSVKSPTTSTTVPFYNHLPPPSIASQNYDLRPRTHNRQLPDHSGHLTDSNFTRLLYNDID